MKLYEYLEMDLQHKLKGHINSEVSDDLTGKSELMNVLDWIYLCFLFLQVTEMN